MRLSMLALGVAFALAAAGPSLAQYVPPGQQQQLLRQQNAAQQEQDAARLSLMETQRALTAAQMRAETTSALRQLEAQRSPTPGDLKALDSEFDAQMRVQESLNAQMTADAQRLAQLQQASLAEGNALILAVRPAVK